MRILRDFILLSLALALAYGGGYYFGRHPNSVRDLVNSESVVIATTEERLFTREIQDWLENRWGHSLIVLLISEKEIEARMQDSDFILAPRSFLKAYETQFRDPPKGLPTDWISPDFLISGDKSLPLLWKLVKIDDQRQRLVKLSLAWTPKSQAHVDLVRWLLSPSLQKLMAEQSGYLPVRRDLLESSNGMKSLRAVPLPLLSYE